MPLGEKLGRPFEMLSLIGRKRKDESAAPHHRISSADARAYANATGAASTGYTYSHSHSHSHSSHSSHSHHVSTGSSFYPGVKYERLTSTTRSAPVVQYERLTRGSAAAPATLATTSGAAPSGRPAITHALPPYYEAVAREAAFPSPDLVPSATVTSSSFRTAPSPALSSLPSPGMLTPLTPSVGVTPSPAPPLVETMRVRPSRKLASPAQLPVGPAGAPSAPFSYVMEEWMSQLRTPTPDVTLLPSPCDFNKDTPTPLDTNSMDLRRLRDALLPTPPPDVHDQRQHPKNSTYVTTRGPRPLLEDIASLCRDLNLQNLSAANKRMLPSSSGQIETKYTSHGARPLRTREESVDSAYSDEGESQARMLAAAAALSSVSSMGMSSTPTFASSNSGTKGKRRKMCIAEGCQNLSRSRGLCKAHGGGRRCSIDGCSRASQSGSLCITHGGGKRCTVDGCAKAAQSRGMCKAHGGGVRCRVEGCAKSSQGDGFCRSHGGGRRCGHPSGCSKWAQRNGMCMAHSEGKYGNSYRGRQYRMETGEFVVQQT